MPGLEQRVVDGPASRERSLCSRPLSKLFSWLVERRRIRQNPCIGVHRPATQHARDRVLTNDEIVAFWWAAGAERAEFTAVLKLLLLTGQRRGEVVGMRRAELSGDFAVWTIPGDTDEEQTRPRRAAVRGCAEHLSPACRRPATSSLRRTASRGQLWVKDQATARRADEECAVAPARFSQNRRNRHGRDRHPAAHRRGRAQPRQRPKAGVAGIYNRAQYAAEKKVALERWAAHVEELIAGGPATNVVPLYKAGP